MISISEKRITLLNSHTYDQGNWVYWMSRDQRVHDNWALLYAAEQAAQHHTKLTVAFCLVSRFEQNFLRHYDFMLTGLAEVEKELHQMGINFVVLSGEAQHVLPAWLTKNQSGGLVTDFSPLRVGRDWREHVAQSITIPMIEVDTHNIVPARHVSQKVEVGARTLRPKINQLLPEFLTEFPKIPSTFVKESGTPIEWNSLIKNLQLDASIPPVTWIKPGEAAALQQLSNFINHHLASYAADRNDPNSDAQSNLSPYLHYGQISAQRVALEVEKARKSGKISTLAADAYLEELIVRRELADNFCLYQKDYDQVAGFPNWAQKSLTTHQQDSRAYIYSLSQLEQAQTHDTLWNAAQHQMAKHGKMHGYLRMYWAKKILEWTPNAATAMKYAIHLNDTYELDGRDPNGYAGIAWSIGGVHDRPWFDRSIFGMIRYMNRNGADKKFDTKKYIEQWT